MGVPVRAAIGLLVLSCATEVSVAQEEEGLYARVFCESKPNLDDLRGQPITDLRLWKSNLRDITPLKGMPLRTLSIYQTNVRDLTPIADAPLEFVRLNAKRLPKGMAVLRRMKTLEQVNNQPPEMFWGFYDAGEQDNLQLPRWMSGWD